MKDIEYYKSKGELISKGIDIKKSNSLIDAAIESANFAKEINISDSTATGIFKSYYDAFHMLGEAKWQRMGYKAVSHYIALKILKDSKIYKLEHLDTFRTIRNDISYEGLKASKDQAKRIKTLWNDVSGQLNKWIR